MTETSPAPAITEPEAARPPAPKPEAVVQPMKMPASAPAAEAGSQEIAPEEFHFVERHLAQHIHDILPKDMVGDMELTLTARPRLGKTDLLLQLNGKMLEPNGALAAEKIMAMLKEHPQFQPMFTRQPEKPFERQPEGHPTTLEIIVPQLTLEEYTTLIHSLKKHAEEKMAGSNVVPLHPQEAKQDTKAGEHPPATTVSNVQREETLAAAKGAISI
jgi:hypothetical protein